MGFSHGDATWPDDLDVRLPKVSGSTPGFPRLDIEGLAHRPRPALTTCVAVAVPSRPTVTTIKRATIEYRATRPCNQQVHLLTGCWPHEGGHCLLLYLLQRRPEAVHLPPAPGRQPAPLPPLLVMQSCGVLALPSSCPRSFVWLRRRRKVRRAARRDASDAAAAVAPPWRAAPNPPLPRSHEESAEGEVALYFHMKNLRKYQYWYQYQYEDVRTLNSSMGLTPGGKENIMKTTDGLNTDVTPHSPIPSGLPRAVGDCTQPPGGRPLHRRLAHSSRVLVPSPPLPRAHVPQHAFVHAAH